MRYSKGYNPAKHSKGSQQIIRFGDASKQDAHFLNVMILRNRKNACPRKINQHSLYLWEQLEHEI